MFTIGCHLSASKGYLAMAKEAVKINANTFQFFTRNPRGGKAKELDLADIQRYLEYAAEHGIHSILAHAPYTLNVCAAKPQLREFAYETMLDDLRRLEHIPGTCYNFHPGSHVGQGSEAGIDLICQTLDRVMEEEHSTTILLETMAGKGSEVGRSFEELRAIMDGTKKGNLLGVCLDTCHISDAGYDIVHQLDSVLDAFDRVIGLDRLRAIHLNDSMNPVGSHKDRHQKIGEGTLGLSAIEAIINHPKLRELPFYLETPNDVEGYAQEIHLLRSMYHTNVS